MPDRSQWYTDASERGAAEMADCARQVLFPPHDGADLGAILGAALFQIILEERGLALVPRNPTDKMRRAFRRGWLRSFRSRYSAMVETVWKDDNARFWRRLQAHRRLGQAVESDKFAPRVGLGEAAAHRGRLAVNGCIEAMPLSAGKKQWFESYNRTDRILITSRGGAHNGRGRALRPRTKSCPVSSRTTVECNSQ